MRIFLANFDRVVAHWILQLFPVQLKPVMIAITNLGDPIVTLAIAALIGGFGIKLNIKLLVAAAVVPVTLIVGGLIKFVVQRARPMNDFIGIVNVDTYSFPSGHSSGSVVAYGLLAYIALHKLPQPWNYILVILLCLIPLLVGISRVYLSAHYPSDVIAGWILGLIGLLVIIYVIRPFS